MLPAFLQSCTGTATGADAGQTCDLLSSTDSRDDCPAGCVSVTQACAYTAPVAANCAATHADWCAAITVQGTCDADAWCTYDSGTTSCKATDEAACTAESANGAAACIAAGHCTYDAAQAESCEVVPLLARMSLVGATGVSISSLANDVSLSAWAR